MSSSQPTDVPPFYGAVETTMNALRLIHAARQGVIPRITRRLNDAERRTMIKSGAVFVFSVEESGIKRWTDGLLWSPSRIVGNFLVYREINERTNSRGSHKKLYPTDEPARALSASEHGTFKPNGLIKKTITVTIDGSDLHLISYYTSADQHSGKLKRPSSRPDIMGLPMDPRLFRATNFRVPPKVEKGPDGTSRLVETEEVASDVVECKIEDEPYSVSVSPTSWGSDSSQGSPIENPFAGTALYPVSSHSSSVYPRVGHSDRWSVPVPTLRPDAWPSHSSHSSHHYTPGRRDAGNSDSWNLSSARWQGETYQPSSPPASSVYVDRSRTRSTNPYPSPLQIPSHRRDSDNSATLNSRYSGHHSGDSRDTSSRLPWLLAGDTDTKEGIRGHHSSGAPFAAPVGQASIYAPQGYHRPMTSHASYNSGWSSNTSSSLAITSSQAAASFSPSSSMNSYASSYAPSSGGMSSPEDYSNADEYGDS
ncbi:Gti1/Pac2 family-domain-containing protein [Mycena albidolilacea]|uniref:Gti1/Pac2 family-domain-containing protein n=1 Tax=Mycena albidolilacea TaxID=1033008 RepID=A0AAD7EWS9_9AGAR|nr:Gti1/Pac2 family-domain-containing protein [Mycena albidolilacea]